MVPVERPPPSLQAQVPSPTFQYNKFHHVLGKIDHDPILIPILLLSS